MNAQPLNDQNAWQPFHARTMMIFCLSSLSPSPSRGSVYPGRVALNPGAFVVLRLAVASANVNANEMSPVPLPVDTLKKNSTKTRGAGGVHDFILGRISAFIYECIHAREKTKTEKTGESTT